MENATTYIKASTPAIEGFFKLLNEYESHKLGEVVNMFKSKKPDEFQSHLNNYSSVDIAREVIAGSILQVAYIAIKQYAIFTKKSENTLYFESQMNRLLSESKKPRTNKKFVLPKEFCVGREIGDLPIGILIYAARNQYNHFDENRLSIVNEVVFNYLNIIHPNPGNVISFNLYDSKHYYSYSVLWALGWTNTAVKLGYDSYKKDIVELVSMLE